MVGVRGSLLEQVVKAAMGLVNTGARSIEARTLAMAGDGRFELFKSSKMFDGPVHRKQHGFDTRVG